VNPALLKLLRADEDPFTGQSYHNLFEVFISRAAAPSEVRKGFYAARLTLQDMPRVDWELKEGAGRHLQVVFFPFKDQKGQEVGWGGAVYEWTRKVSQVKQTLEAAADLLIKLPWELASIQGQFRALSKHQLGWGQDTPQELFQTLNLKMNQVAGQIEQALELVRFEREGLLVYPEEVDLDELVSEFLDHHIPQFPNLTFHYPEDLELPAVRVDPGRIADVFKEITRFAASRSPNSCDMTIDIDVLDRDLKVSIFVKPEGEERRPPPLSSHGYRGAAEIGDFVLSQGIIQSHGGQIWIEDMDGSQNEGFKISFLLPQMPLQKSLRIKDVQPIPDKKVQRTILIAGSDSDTLHLLTSVLRENGYQVKIASDGPSVVDITQAEIPDLIILEWELAGMNGLHVSRYIRRWSSIPILMLTTKTHPEPMVEAFEAGVDDYLVKPFLVDEVLVRVEALLRRTRNGDADKEPEVFERRGLRIDYDSQQVWCRGDMIEITPLEYRLLTYMSQHQRQVLPYQQLIEHVWDAPDKGSRRGLFVHVRRLREKIERDPENPEFIVNRWGVGYAFLPD
jgi:DNA-binding response OmpR family regulator